MRPACGNQDGIAYKPQQFAGIGVLHCAAAADVPGKQQGAELMVRKAFDRSCAFFPAHSIDQSGHQLLSRIALCKGRPLFLLSAKIPQVEFIVICHVELYSQTVQTVHQFGRSLRHSPRLHSGQQVRRRRSGCLHNAAPGCPPLLGIQAAIIGSEKGHPFTKELLDYYHTHQFVNEQGEFDQTPAPVIYSWLMENED